MKLKHAALAIAVSTPLLLGPLASAQDSDTDRAHAKTYAHDSAITTRIKTKLATEHITSLARIHVDTDENGKVWLRGTAPTQEAADKAVEIARNTEGVTKVDSAITVKPKD